MTSVSNPVAMAFPPIATDPATVSGAWMGPGSVSDYASNYFTSMKTRTTYPWSEGIQEMVSSMDQSFFSRQPLPDAQSSAAYAGQLVGRLLYERAIEFRRLPSPEPICSANRV